MIGLKSNTLHYVKQVHFVNKMWYFHCTYIFCTFFYKNVSAIFKSIALHYAPRYWTKVQYFTYVKHVHFWGRFANR